MVLQRWKRNVLLDFIQHCHQLMNRLIALIPPLTKAFTWLLIFLVHVIVWPSFTYISLVHCSNHLLLYRYGIFNFICLLSTIDRMTAVYFNPLLKVWSLKASLLVFSFYAHKSSSTIIQYSYSGTSPTQLVYLLIFFIRLFIITLSDLSHTSSQSSYHCHNCFCRISIIIITSALIRSL